MIVDLEYTSWEGALERGWSRPNEHREVVQIGAVRLDAGNGFAEVDAFSALVRPRINAVLSDYFIRLTGITNDRLATAGTGLAPALQALADFAGDALLLSNGPDDAVIVENCALIDVDNPLAAARWHDIEPELQRIIGGPRVHSAAIPAKLGLPVDGAAHDALADARAIAAGLQHLRGQGKL